MVSRRCGLAPISYRPLWDGLAPSFADGTESYKLDPLQYLHTEDNLADVEVGGSVLGTYGCYHLHSAVGCECQFDGDLGVDRVDISIGLNSNELFPLSVPRVSFQMILMLMLVIWVLVLEELLVYSRDST